MKKIICILTVIVTVIFSVTAVAEISQLNSEKKILKTEKNFCEDPMFELLKSNIPDVNEKEKAMVEYGKRKVLGLISENEAEYLYNCLKETDNFEAVFEAYDFIKEFDKDTKLVKDIVKLHDKENINWVKNAYAKVTKTENKLLTYEKRKEYFKKGISEKQMAIAEKLSLKGNKKIEDVLKKFLNKKSSISMLKDEYSEELSGLTAVMLKLKNLKDEDYEKLENAIYLNKLTGESIIKALQYEDIEGEISEYKRQAASKARLELINSGLISENYGKSEGKIKFDDKVHKMTLDLGVPQETIDTLKKEGYSIIDIYNMYITKED